MKIEAANLWFQDELMARYEDMACREAAHRQRLLLELKAAEQARFKLMERIEYLQSSRGGRLTL